MSRIGIAFSGGPSPSEIVECVKLAETLDYERTDVPVPWPYRVETSADILGWDFALMPALPGLRLADPAVRASLSAEDESGIARALGEVLAELHGAQLPLAGEYGLAADGIVPLDVPWPERIAGQVRHSLAAARRHSDRTTGTDVTWVESILDDASNALAVSFVPVPVHGDFAWNKNNFPVQDFYLTEVVKRDDGKIVTSRVSTVFPHYGDAYADQCSMD